MTKICKFTTNGFALNHDKNLQIYFCLCKASAKNDFLKDVESTVTFIIILLSSRYDLNNVEKDVKYQPIIIISEKNDTSGSTECIQSDAIEDIPEYAGYRQMVREVKGNNSAQTGVGITLASGMFHALNSTNLVYVIVPDKALLLFQPKSTDVFLIYQRNRFCVYSLEAPSLRSF